MNEEKKDKKIQEMSDWVELRDSWTRKRFDYKERWHGWRSAFGLIWFDCPNALDEYQGHFSCSMLG